MTEPIINITKVERPNSIQFRLGGVGSEMKIYFNDEQDLITQLMRLEEKIPSIKYKIQGLKQIMKEE